MFVFDAPEQPADPRRDRRRLLVTLVVAVVVGAAWYAFTYWSTDTVACIYVVEPDGEPRQEDVDLCHRQHRDRDRRAAISSPGPVGYEGTAVVMRQALVEVFGCPPRGDPACYRRKEARVGTAADVQAAKRALVGAGLADSEVRLARREDPAPDGTLVYALRMGDGCVVGHLEVGTGKGDHLVGGLLPNGRCLAS